MGKEKSKITLFVDYLIICVKSTKTFTSALFIFVGDFQQGCWTQGSYMKLNQQQKIGN